MMRHETARYRVYGRLLSTAVLASCVGCAATPVRSRQPSADSAQLTVHEPALYPETIAYDRKRDVFLLGSFRNGAVYVVDRAGTAKRIVDDARLCSVLGIAVDAARDRVWVVSSDLGASVKPSAAGARHLAAVGVYDLASGAPVHYVDLAPLANGDHLLNGIALDAAGNAYVTDSFTPAIYKIDASGASSLFVQDDRFRGEGINLNGLVVHPDGYLLVVKKSDGRLFKVPLADPRQLSEVKLERPLIGGDGLTMVGRSQLWIVANQVPNLAVNTVFALQSSDGWTTAALRASHALGPVYPTTGVVRDGKLYVLASRLNELIQAPRAAQPQLQAEATIREVASVSDAGAPTEIRRTLLAKQNVAGAEGLETQLWLIEYAPGAAAPTHRHPVVGVGYVFEGEYESVFGDDPKQYVKAGETFVDPARVEHRMFRNPSPDKPLRFVVAYTIPSGTAPVEF